MTWSNLMNRDTNKFSKIGYLINKFGSNFMNFGAMDN
jgi:hypothetical protein